MKDIIKVMLIMFAIIFGIIILFLYKLGSESDYIDKNKIIQTYINNKDIFNELSNYALENPKDISIYELNSPKNIAIEKDDATNANIDIKKVQDDCMYLSKKIRYRYVVEDDDTIQFIKQSDLGWGQGILYLKNEDKVSRL